MSSMNQSCTRCDRARRVSRYGNRTEAIGAKSIRSRSARGRGLIVISHKPSHGFASRRPASPPWTVQTRSPIRKKEDKRRTLRINKPALNTEVAYMPPSRYIEWIVRPYIMRRSWSDQGTLTLKGRLSLLLSWTQFYVASGGYLTFGTIGSQRKKLLYSDRLMRTHAQSDIRGLRGFRLHRIHHRGTSYYRPSSFSLHFRDSLPRLSGLSEISVWSLDQKDRAG